MAKLIIKGCRFGQDVDQAVEFDTLTQALDIFYKEIEFSKEYVVEDSWTVSEHYNYWSATLDDKNYLVLEVEE